MVSHCIYHSCLAISASSNNDLSEFSEFERHHYNACIGMRNNYNSLVGRSRPVVWFIL